MIITNGTISAKVKAGGGLDDNGNPVEATYTWGAPIPANIKANRHDNLGKSNGNAFIAASYEVLIAQQPFDAEVVRLVNSADKEIGEFSILSVEQLAAVGATKIMV